MKGFRDFYPEDFRILKYIFDTWRKVARKYGYEEVESSLLEPIQLYNKSGDEIPEQIYSFKDKGNRLIALRPETTPSIARMIKDRKDLKLPIKWFSISQCFRYERMQQGRSRSFFQFNLDCLGSKSVKLDAEVIVTLVNILKEFKLNKNDFYIRISNRRLINDLLNELNIKEVKDIARLVDKKGKISDKDMKAALRELNLNEKQINGLFELFDVKNLKNLKIKSEGLEELRELFKLLKNYDVDDYCKLDLSIMRGFDYYTGVVFEAFDKKGDFRALAGGGRYDDLAGLPGVGYGFGDLVLKLFLEQRKKLPVLKKNLDFYLISIDQDKEVLKLAEKLREKFKVEIDLIGRNLKKQLSYASDNSRYVVIVGKEEVKQKKFKLKDLESREEKLVSFKYLMELD